VQVHVGLEVDPRGQAMAWVAELPGCYARGRTAAAALEKIPLAVYEYCVWLAAHGEPIDPPGEVEIVEVERVAVTSDLGQALSQGFFRFDRDPVSAQAPRLALTAMQHARRDLLELLPHVRNRRPDPREEPVRSLPELLDHVLLMDLWLALRALQPEDVEARAYLLETLRDILLPLLEEAAEASGPAREYTARTLPVEDHERWTGFKALRRTVWHDRVHYRQLKRLDQRPPMREQL
jgi:predicted RNase H-like HicB family nuclease